MSRLVYYAEARSSRLWSACLCVSFNTQILVLICTQRSYIIIIIAIIINMCTGDKMKGRLTSIRKVD